MQKTKVINIMGKEINYGELSDAKLLKLYKELREREVTLYNRIMEYDKQYGLLSEIDVSDIM
jgi:hypothetical protein